MSTVTVAVAAALLCVGMSGKDRLGVQAGYWMARARRAAQDAADKVEARTGAVSSARRAAEKVVSRRDRVVDRSSQTRTGRAAGKAMRSLASIAARMPLAGLTTDALSARHGLGPLAEHLREHPDDPMAGARLLDAMARADRDRRRYRAVRTVVDPTSWVTRSATAVVADMGKDDTAFADRLGRSVYALSVADLREDPTDGRAWHALARVHLAREDVGGARQLAKLAALADPHERATALVTLARAELAAGLLPEADRTAVLAVAAGQTMGWDVRSDVHEQAAVRDERPDSRRARLDEAARWKAMVTADDRAEYLGVHIDAAGVVRGVGVAQQRKTATLAGQAKSIGGKWAASRTAQPPPPPPGGPLPPPPWSPLPPPPPAPLTGGPQ